MQTLMDVADVKSQFGVVRCRPVLPETQVVHIPPVWSDRIGYVAVQLDQSLRSDAAGITKTVSTDELPISQLRSLELEHLIQIRQAKFVKMPVNLSKWLEPPLRRVGSLWSTFRHTKRISLQSQTSVKWGCVKRAKLIDLGLRLGVSQSLLVAITPEVEQKVGILGRYIQQVRTLPATTSD